MLRLKNTATGAPLLTKVETEREEHRERALRESHRAEKSEAMAETAVAREAAANAEIERLKAELAALKKSKK